MTIIRRPNKRLPKWQTEYVELQPAIADFIRSTIKAMVERGRAKNPHEKQYNNRHVIDFERRSQVKFKRIKNTLKT